MVRRHISDDIKEMALSMSLQGIRASEIRELTGISERSLKRLRSTYRKTGTGAAVVKGDDLDRPRMLTAMAVQVCHTSLDVHYNISFHTTFSSFVTALHASLT